MKFAVLALPLVLVACSTTAYMRDAQPLPPPGPEEAKVVFYRTASFGGSDHFPVFEVVDPGGKLLGFTETDCYFEVLCRPGHHLFCASGEGDAFVSADLEGGKTYFVRAYSKFGWVTSRPGFAPVGRESEEWSEMGTILKTHHCRTLDPSQSAQLDRREAQRLKQAAQESEEARSPTRALRPEDGQGEAALEAK